MTKYNHDHDCPFEIFLTNLGKYNEGELVGRWVKMPATEETIDQVKKEIGIGTEDYFGVPYEEVFITDYDQYVEGLYSVLGEYESLDTLNEIATALEEMDDETYQKFLALVEDQCLMCGQDVLDLINDLDKWEFLSDIKTATDYADYLINNGTFDFSSCPGIEKYIDRERMGEDEGADGTFTNYGYIEWKG